MMETATHAEHPEGTARLRYPEGHLDAAVTLLESGRPGHIAQQFQALACAFANHMAHCLDTNGADQARAESTAITHYR